MSHCPACAVREAITNHRDAHEADWSPRRAAFNFAIVLAKRECAEYVPANQEDQ